MKITKFEHACLILDNGTSRLLIDPGSFTTLPENLSNINCIVVTEEHADHFDLENIKKVLSQSPDVKIFSTKVVAKQLTEAGYSCEAVSCEEHINVDGFSLTFKEGDHAISYDTSPCRVLTIKVDDFLYYPSDSFIPTEATVQVLALPTSGPWHKISESIDFANKITSKYILVTHNGLYNDIGNTVANSFTSNNVADKNREYIFLAVGETKDFS
ncbi:MAG: MBL fold metallo-hydrolase [Candidatus Saccharimonadales bacterium]